MLRSDAFVALQVQKNWLKLIRIAPQFLTSRSSFCNLVCHCFVQGCNQAHKLIRKSEQPSPCPVCYTCSRR
jgi:hypothetical protein